MDIIDHTSDDLLREIMHIEHGINKILALNGNKENHTVKKYRKHIAARKNKLFLLNNNYEGVLD